MTKDDTIFVLAVLDFGENSIYGDPQCIVALFNVALLQVFIYIDFTFTKCLNDKTFYLFLVFC